MQQKASELTLEKLKIDERLRAVEQYMAQGIIERKSIGDALVELKIAISSVDHRIDGKKGFEARFQVLETDLKERAKVKGEFIKIAVGSLTMAVGAAVLWVGNVIIAAWASMGKH